MRRASAFLRRFGDDRSGATALVTGLAMIVVLGAAGLGTDVAGWYAARRDAQHAADSAAVSAATAVMAGGGDYETQARAIAATYGVRHGEGGVTVTVEEIDDGEIEVVVQRPARRFFSRLFLVDARTIEARAVAKAGRTGNACVLALHPTASGAAGLGGATNVNLKGCSLAANSSSASAFKIWGAAKLTAAGLNIGGGYERSGAASIKVPAADIHTHQSPIPDPYGNLPPFDDWVGCDYPTKVTVSGTNGRPFFNDGVNPEIFCDGLKISGTGTVTFEPGVYVFNGGDFEISGTADVVAEGVTFILAGHNKPRHATLKFSGTSNLKLTAPKTGPYTGLVFVQERDAPANGSNVITGASDSIIEGAIYLPNQSLSFHGASATGADGCIQIVASKVEFTGASALGINCTGVGVRPIGGARTVLIR